MHGATMRKFIYNFVNSKSANIEIAQAEYTCLHCLHLVLTWNSKPISKINSANMYIYYILNAKRKTTPKNLRLTH